MLVRRFNLKDIRDYEDETNESILEYFDHISVLNLLKLVSLGNSRCTLEEASKILDEYLQEHEFLDAVYEIRDKLIGKVRDDDSKEEIADSIDITKYNSLSELYDTYCMQLMSVGFSYSEFWDLSTNTLFKVFNSINIKRENEINQNLQLAHTQAALIGQAVWGKLQRKPPSVNLDKPITNEEELEIAAINRLEKIFKIGKNGG